MDDLDITTLRLFISVCDSKNIASVAKKVKMDSSAITRRIQKLEAEAGRPLLKRVRNGVEPTPEGLQFCDLSRGSGMPGVCQKHWLCTKPVVVAESPLLQPLPQWLVC